MNPQNCEKFTVPKVNKGIWSSLQRKAKDQDLKLQQIQSIMCKTFYPLAHLMDKLLKSQSKRQSLSGADLNDCLTLCNDTFKLLQLGFTEMSQRRRLSLKPELANEYKALCSSEIPVSDYLFGDDLEKQIREITDAKKVSRKITEKNNQGQRFSPYKRNQHGYNKQTTYKPSNGRYNFNAKKGGKSSFLEKRPNPKMQRNKQD
jgi:hypothetical protein